MPRAASIPSETIVAIRMSAAVETKGSGHDQRRGDERANEAPGGTRLGFGRGAGLSEETRKFSVARRSSIQSFAHNVDHSSSCQYDNSVR